MIMRFMREKFHLWVFWSLVVVLAVGLVLPGVGIGKDRDAVAMVGKDKVSLDEFNRVLQCDDVERFGMVDFIQNRRQCRGFA